MRNTGLEESQAEIKNAERKINNLRYGDDTILMAEIEEELKSLLISVGNANQNNNEVPLHASQDGCYPKVYKQ